MRTEKSKYELRVLCFVLFLSLFQPSSSFAGKGVNGGVYCVACTAVAALADQLSDIHNETFVKSFDRLCKLLPAPVFQNACVSLGKYYIPMLVDIITKHTTADVICHAIDLCYTQKGKPTCHAFPSKGDFNLAVYEAKKKLALAGFETKTKSKDGFIMNEVDPSQPRFDPCVLPGVKKLCNLFERIFSDHHPLLDFDNDFFSALSLAWRGISWRGRDCDDFDALIHPGAIDKGDVIYMDKNCNGIWGKDFDSGKSYEELFCKKTGNLGLIVLGDSVAAHFRIPPQWLTASELKESVFDYAPFILGNEADWPQLSLFTGYLKESRWPVEKGNATSLYLKLFERNHCNHRDYQNLAKNGADSFDVNNILLNSLTRNKSMDQPALVFYALMGNDVCNHWHNMDHMTTPDQMRANLLKTLDTLDKQLPNGSHVVVVGLTDGRILYNSIHNRIHPIGKLHGDVTYSNFYDFMNCVDTSPCYGWLNSNETVRNLTSERAFALSAALKDVVDKTKGYKHFDVFFLDNPFPQVYQEWVAKGNEVWQLIEPTDGFHPNLVAESLTADAAWNILESKIPHVLGKVNPNNAKIKELFGDQGGY